MRLEKIVLLSFMLYPLLQGGFSLKAYSQQFSRSARPSFIQSKGYSVSSSITTGTSQESQGEQLVTSNKADAVLLSPRVEDSSDDDVTFIVTPTSSIAEIMNINHKAFFQFGEGTLLNTLVETKENPVIESTPSQASSTAFVIINTSLNVYTSETTFAESY